MSTTQTTIMNRPEMLPAEYVSMYGKQTTRQVKELGIRRYLEIYLGRKLTAAELDDAMVEYQTAYDNAQIANHLIHYHSRPEVQTLAPNSRQSYLSAAEVYFAECCHVRLSGLQKKFRKRNSTEKILSITQEYNPTREIIADVLSLCGVRHRAEILICASGGLRIGELLHIRLSDVFLDEMPVRIEIPGSITKNKLPRRTFISTEAANALKAYLQTRDEMLQRLRINSRRVHHDYSPDASRIFPHSDTYESEQMRQIVSKSQYNGIDERTGRNMFHFHSLRKFFLTQAKKHASPDFVEAWAGHAGYLSAAYHRPSLEEERAEYLKCELSLTINVPEDYLRLKLEHQNEIEQLREVSLAQQEMLSRLQDELRMLRNEKQTSPALVIPTSLD